MRAFVQQRYGPPDGLALGELTTPRPAAGEVLVRVRATSVNPYDWHHLRGQPYVSRLLPGGPALRRPKLRVLGCDLAGRVESVGRSVTDLRPGDDVFGLLPGGGFGEYVAAPERLLAPKPATLSYAQAAAMPMAALTALIALRDAGRIRAGQRVLVNGASGGVGTFAVQIARAFGAFVTGVCGIRNVDLVRSIGANEVVDYRTVDFTRGADRHDLLVDIAGSHPLSAYRRVLASDGTIVLVGGPAGRWMQPAGRIFGALAGSPLVPQRVVLADAVRYADKRQALATLAELVEAGKLTPVIDRCYPFEEIPDAVSYQEAGHAPGKVVVELAA